MSTDLVISAAPNPFSAERHIIQMAPGETLDVIIQRAGVPPYADVRVYLERGDIVYGPVPSAEWRHIRPRAGTRVIIRAVPHGAAAGGGDSNKTTRLILTIVVLLVAVVLTVAFPYLAPLWGFLAAVDIAAINYVFPPKFDALSMPPPPMLKVAKSSTYALGGSRNRADLYGPVPVVYGQHRVFPPFGAQPFTELLGDDQYLRQLFIVGYGRLTLSDLRIGDTPIDQYEGVEYEVREGTVADDPITLYANDVAETPLSATLRQDGGPQTRTAPQPADELSVDISFLQGLGWINTDGLLYGLSVAFTIEYRKVGDANWIAIDDSPVTITDAKMSQVRRGYRWKVTPRETYEVRITRTTADDDRLVIHDEATWTSLRAFQAAPPVTKARLCQVALRIKATDQLQGIVDQFNCLAQAILPDWDNGTQQWVTRATASPAAAYRAALQGNGNARPVADSRIALASLQQWAVDAAAGGFTFNEVVDFRHTVFEQLRDIAAAGRASLTLIDGKFAVVQDKAQTTPVQHFTPRNSADFHGMKSFIQIPHALKVRFINPDADWRQDERKVYDDGYTEANATRYEVMDTLGVTNADQAWKLGRYHLAAMRLRPEMYQFTTDFENLVCTRGDLVQLSHDVLLVGLAAGRVVSVQTSGPNCTGVTLDEECPMVQGKTYGVRMRYADGTSVVKVVVTNPGAPHALVFQTPFGAPMPAVGDLVLFGESGLESMPVIIKEIAHDRDLVARVTCLPYSPAIYAADQGAIPQFDTMITLPPLVNRGPATPIINAAVSDESVLVRDIDGSLVAQILLSITTPATSAVRTDWIEAQYRRSDSPSPYTALPHLPPSSTEISIRPVDEGITYDVRLRGVNADGPTSEWATVLNHTVVGKSSKPPDPTGLSLQNGILSWAYADPPRDLLGFHIRRIPGGAAIWDQGLQMHSGAYSATAYALAAIMFGEWTLMVKAVDTNGHFSDGMASLTYDFGTGLLHNAVESRDEHAYGFPGTKTDCTVEGGTGDLIADSVATGFWTQDNALFWTADGNAFWGGTYEEMVYQWTYTTGASAGGTSLLLDVGAQGNWRAEYKKSADSDWLPVQGSVPGMLANTSYDLRITIDAGAVQGRISQLVLYFDAPDVDETFAAFATAVTTGTRLTLTKTYRAIKTVSPTVVASGVETAISALAADKQATAGANNGPLIKSLDAAGNVVAGHVDVLVRGY